MTSSSVIFIGSPPRSWATGVAPGRAVASPALPYRTRRLWNAAGGGKPRRTMPGRVTVGAQVAGVYHEGWVAAWHGVSTHMECRAEVCNEGRPALHPAQPAFSEVVQALAGLLRRGAGPYRRHGPARLRLRRVRRASRRYR